MEDGTELTGLSTGGDVVTAAVRSPGGQAETITAGYVAGCDGAHSRVRRELGLTFQGHPYPQDWLLADVLLDWDLREDATHAFFRPDGQPVIFFPMRGHRWRLTLPFVGGRAAQAPTLAEIQHLTDQRAPRPVTLSDPTWLANFRCHRRSASAYRRGRVLLAGDAVHIHTPAGGQGLNTGMLDAHNLSWKLALVASGRTSDALLDTYGTERRPVAEKVLELTHVLIRYGTMSHPVKRRVRDIVVPALGRTPVIQRRAARRISQIYVSYPPGPAARQDSGRGAPRVGQRMPNIQVSMGSQATALHSVLRGGRHVLIVPASHLSSALGDAALRFYGTDLDVVTGDVTQPLRVRDHRTGPVVLVRPDGHVAARGRPGNMAAVAGCLRDLFGVPAASTLKTVQETPSTARSGTKDDPKDADAGAHRTELSVSRRRRDLHRRRGFQPGVMHVPAQRGWLARQQMRGPAGRLNGQLNARAECGRLSARAGAAGDVAGNGEVDHACLARDQVGPLPVEVQYGDRGGGELLPDPVQRLRGGAFHHLGDAHGQLDEAGVVPDQQDGLVLSACLPQQVQQAQRGRLIDPLLVADRRLGG